MSIKSLIINPGSTSTKIGVFEDETLVFEQTLRHTSEELSAFSSIIEQKDFREKIITDALASAGITLGEINVVVGRGGLLRPVPSGTYKTTDALLDDLENGRYGFHASNLGAILARKIGDSISIPSYIVDPVVVDELSDVARVTGHPDFPKRSIFHALNQKAVAKQYAKSQGKSYNEMRLIVVHMGGGVSIGTHLDGRIVDVNNCLDGDGPFSPERSGSLPTGKLVEMCFSGRYTKEEMYKMLVGEGGFNALLGTNDIKGILDDAEAGDKKSSLYIDAFIYQVSKEIGAAATVLEGRADAIILTGGIAYSEKITAEIKHKVEFIAPVVLVPGEDELLALVRGGLAVLSGEEEAFDY